MPYHKPKRILHPSYKLTKTGIFDLLQHPPFIGPVAYRLSSSFSHLALKAFAEHCPKDTTIIPGTMHYAQIKTFLSHINSPFYLQLDQNNADHRKILQNVPLKQLVHTTDAKNALLIVRIDRLEHTPKRRSQRHHSPLQAHSLQGDLSNDTPHKRARLS